MSNETIVISGEENVRAVQAIARLHYWRTTGYMRKYAFEPRKGWTIKAFNAEYGQSARTWDDVVVLTSGMIKAMRDKAAQS